MASEPVAHSDFQDAPRILVVDDEAGARTALVHLLSDEGFNVFEASDGYKALGLLKETKPDLLLTDLKMPLMDGITLLKKSQGPSTRFGEHRDDGVCIGRNGR